MEYLLMCILCIGNEIGLTHTPTQLVVSRVSQTSLQLRWTSAHSGVDYYNVYCYHTSCPYCSHLPSVGTVTTTSTIATVNGLTPLTEYECCVTAISSSGESQCSQEVRNSTLPGSFCVVINYVFDLILCLYLLCKHNYS